MPWRELFAKEILIHIADDDLGFIYSVKCAGVTLEHGFVHALYEEEGAGAAVFVRPRATKPDERSARDDHTR